MSVELKLVHFGRAFGRPDGSPFCVKPEAYLRLIDVPYDLVRGNPMKSPRKQLPVLLHGNKTIAGSQEIIEHLRAEFGNQVDAWLTQEQEVQGYHLAKSVEEYLYFLLLYQRWMLEENFQLVKRAFFGEMPLLARFLIPILARRGSKQRLWGQGVGRYTAEEVDARAYEAVKNLSQTLGEKPFFLGDKPCWVDCSMYGFVTNLMIPDFPRGASLWVREFDNLVAYETRFTELAFPELLQ